MASIKDGAFSSTPRSVRTSDSPRGVRDLNSLASMSMDYSRRCSNPEPEETDAFVITVDQKLKIQDESSVEQYYAHSKPNDVHRPDRSVNGPLDLDISIASSSQQSSVPDTTKFQITESYADHAEAHEVTYEFHRQNSCLDEPHEPSADLPAAPRDKPQSDALEVTDGTMQHYSGFGINSGNTSCPGSFAASANNHAGDPPTLLSADTLSIDGLSVFVEVDKDDGDDEGNNTSSEFNAGDDMLKDPSLSGILAGDETIATRDGVPSVKGSAPTSNQVSDEEETPDEVSEAFSSAPFVLEKHFEFRHVTVNLTVKGLSGVSQVKHKKKTSLWRNPDDDDEDDTVTAVVSYVRNTLASDKFVSTHIPSLPLLVEMSDKRHGRVRAKWPEDIDGDDDDSRIFHPSTLSFTRTVRRVKYLDSRNDQAEDKPCEQSTSKEREDDVMNSKAKKEHKNFLSSISMAFAPELIDLRVGLMRCSREIIPLGIATVVVSGEYQTIDLDIPIVRDYTGGGMPEFKKKNGYFSLGGRTSKNSKGYVCFSADKSIKYTVSEGAFLHLQLKVEPATAKLSHLPPSSTVSPRKADFRLGPINKAIRKRRKVEHLLSLKKLSLHQRIQLFFELRNSQGSYDVTTPPEFGTREAPNYDKNDFSHTDLKADNKSYNRGVPNLGHGSCVATQTGLPHQSIHEAGSINNECLIDGNSFSLSISNNENDDVSTLGNSISSGYNETAPTSKSKLSQTKSKISKLSSRKLDARSHRNNSDMSRRDNDKAPVADINLPEVIDEQPGLATQINDDCMAFSSSMYSIFSTNHPQKQAVTGLFCRLLACDASLFLCDHEIKTLNYYINEIVDEALQLSPRRLMGACLNGQDDNSILTGTVGTVEDTVEKIGDDDEDDTTLASYTNRRYSRS